MWTKAPSGVWVDGVRDVKLHCMSEPPRKHCGKCAHMNLT